MINLNNSVKVLLLSLILIFNIYANNFLYKKQEIIEYPVVVKESLTIVEKVVTSVEEPKKEIISVEKSREEVFIQTPEEPPEPFIYGCYRDGNPLDGFMDDWGYCVPGLVTNKSWFLKAPQYSYGAVVYYAPGIMESTAKFREMNLEGYLGGVALQSPADIGETVWLRRVGHTWEGPFLSVDCARRGDMYSNVIIRQTVVEVDFATAQLWGMAVYTSTGYKTLNPELHTVEVWVGKEKPSENIYDEQLPIYYAEWYLNNLVYMRDSIDASPYFYPNGENPEWDIRDGAGKQCFIIACD